jgi:glycosyltransferase involved in cell wall biosynthesis
MAVELAAAVDPDRYDVRVLATKMGGPLERVLDATGIPYAVLGRRRRTSVRTVRELVSAARASNLVHSHLFGNNLWGAVAARLAGRPLITHEHNRVARTSRLEPVIDRLLIEPAAFRIVCASESVAESLVRNGVPRRKMVVIPNGVPLDAALPRAEARRELGLADDVPVVGSVAVLRREKALDLLLEAFGRLRASGARGVLCIVGDGPEERRLERLAEQIGVAGDVLWAGRRDDARRLMRAFDVAVLCSRTEGLPLAALEAMAAGVPLVATRVGALPELVSDGSGVLVDPDPGSLALAISDLLSDAGKRARIGRVARARVVEEHDFGAQVRQVESLYALATERAGR